MALLLKKQDYVLLGPSNAGEVGVFSRSRCLLLARACWCGSAATITPFTCYLQCRKVFLLDRVIGDYSDWTESCVPRYIPYRGGQTLSSFEKASMVLSQGTRQYRRPLVRREHAHSLPRRKIFCHTVAPEMAPLLLSFGYWSVTNHSPRSERPFTCRMSVTCAT